MPIIRLIVLIIFFGNFSSQAQSTLYRDDFSGSSQLFGEIKNQHSKSGTRGGKYQWTYLGQTPAIMSVYANRLDISKGFSIEATIKPLKAGTEYGLAWGGVDPQNSYYFLIKGKKFSVCKVVEGRITCEPDQKPAKIRSDYNLMKIEQKGGQIYYYANDILLVKKPVDDVMGNSFGLALWKSGEVQMDDLLIKGVARSINSPKDFRYPQQAEHLGNTINSPYEEMTPVVTPNGKGIYFSRRFDPDNTGGQGDLQDVYYSRNSGTGWTAPENIGPPVNNEGPNAVFSVTPDGNTLLVMNTYKPDGKQKGMGMSLSRRTSKGWSIPEDVKMRQFYNQSFFNEYFLSNDGKVILLAVKRKDGLGSRDLYVSFAEGNGIWTAPRNLGPDVNTPGTELSPFLAADGKTMYFSSNGHPGYGKNDIFMTKRLDETWTSWSEPVNLGPPINSAGTDAYYSLPAAGDYAYFVSNESGAGRNDIFRIALPTAVMPEPVVLVYGKVLNSKTSQPLETEIHYQTFVDNREVGEAHSDPDQGYYEIVLPISQIYSFFAEKPGFYSIQDRLDLSGVTAYEEIERDLYLTPIEAGQTVQMHNVLFYQSKAQLIPTSYPELNRLASMMKDNPSITIELAGHTDNVGDREKNLKLSEDRVDAVKKYLVNQGVEAQRITGKGYGGSKPVADNSREITRRLNRRVEFKIIQY